MRLWMQLCLLASEEHGRLALYTTYQKEGALRRSKMSTLSQLSRFSVCEVLVSHLWNQTQGNQGIIDFVQILSWSRSTVQTPSLDILQTSFPGCSGTHMVTTAQTDISSLRQPFSPQLKPSNTYLGISHTLGQRYYIGSIFTGSVFLTLSSQSR